MSLIASLRSLPPKQALALALAERARRTKLRTQLTEQVRATKPEADANAQGLIPVISEGATSLVLNKDLVYSDLYYKHADYIVLWGGRGGAKTWAVAEALVRKAAATALLIGCAREYQNSIRDSSYRVIKNTIERLGLLPWFTITESSIKSKAGSEFVFKGLSNTDSLRSFEGCDILWVEEAQSVTEASWRAIIPTIRKPGAMIWVTFNLMDEKDATYQRFVVHKTADMIVHKVNFDSNPFFGGKLQRDMEADKARDYHLYEHIWLGMPLKISNAIIFNRKYVVDDFPVDLWKTADVIPHHGIDWGFAQDPFVVTRNFALEQDTHWKNDGKRRLFISHAAFKVGLEISDMREFIIDRIPGIEEWSIKADSARPELISDLRRKGFNVSAAEKWEGSVKDGIAHLRGFDEIVIHQSLSQPADDATTCMAEEARLYRYKVDPRQVDENGQPQVLPIIVDKFNHGWDATRYSRDGYITRGGDVGIWARLAEAAG